MNNLKAIDLKLIGISLSKWLRHHRIDNLIVVAFSIAIGITTYLASQQIPDPILIDFYAQDVWFGSDLPTVFGNITSLKSDFGRNNKHPLFPILVFPVVYGLGQLFNLEPITATRLVLTLVAVVWIAALYSLFRLIGCQRLDSTLFSLLGLVSAASVFWFVVPDSFSFASLTILLGLVFVALAQKRQFSSSWYIALGVLTVSITITNWMVGLLATIVNHRWKKTVQITALTLLVVNVIWVVQRVIFTNTGFSFQPKTFMGEKKFMTGLEHGSVLSAISSFTYQTIVMPAVQFADTALRPDWPRLNADSLAPASGGFWGLIAVIAWTGLLGLGIWGFFSTKKHPKLRAVLGFTILGQLLIHSVYGTQETFLYSLHFAPLLLTVAAFSSFTPLRLLGLVLAGLLVISAGINNRSLFNQVTTRLLDYGTPRQQVQAQIRIRPADYWPRSTGHILLGRAGSRAEEKAYYEPGGSFSPEVGSFGLAIWMVDSNGTIKTTSDSVPINQIQQQFINTPEGNIAGVVAKTEVYEASWYALKSGTWQLTLNTSAQSLAKPTIVIRSVGPAAGDIKSLAWNGQKLLINDRWVVTNLPSQTNVYLGSERSLNWTHQKSTAVQWQDEKGWGVARLELGTVGTVNLVIEDVQAKSQQNLKLDGPLVQPILNLPDTQFIQSFKAQITHLRTGIVGNQTRPGDPIDYPLPRFRDGAYEMVALARAGQLELVKPLVPYFASTDFMNGTQMEADIPALGIWALTTIAAQVNQPEYDRQLWPDVQRKAELIMDLLATNRPGYPVVEKTRVPFSEHPDFLEMELTAGEMNASPGLIALDPEANFMSYRALLDAATLADRLQETEAANRWRSQATKLQIAWQKAFDQRFVDMDATYTTGLWPSNLAALNQDALQQGLETRWKENYDNNGNLRQLPENTNFHLAEAHQWLRLNQLEKTWTTLRWFWHNQASPGLYTWWGSHNDPHIPGSLSQWYRFRGWVNPPHFTPYYWASAEMLLLQLDMLTYLDTATSQPTLVIGAGVPKEWLRQPMSVENLFVNGNLVNWQWDGKQMTVQIRGQKMAVQLGQSFPKNTSVNIKTL